MAPFVEKMCCGRGGNRWERDVDQGHFEAECSCADIPYANELQLLGRAVELFMMGGRCVNV